MTGNTFCQRFDWRVCVEFFPLFFSTKKSDTIATRCSIRKKEEKKNTHTGQFNSKCQRTRANNYDQGLSSKISRKSWQKSTQFSLLNFKKTKKRQNTIRFRVASFGECFYFRFRFIFIFEISFFFFFLLYLPLYFNMTSPWNGGNRNRKICVSFVFVFLFFYFCGIGIGIAQETEKNNNSLERILPKVCTIKHRKRKKKIDDTLNGECFFRFFGLLFYWVNIERRRIRNMKPTIIDDKQRIRLRQRQLRRWWIWNHARW